MHWRFARISIVGSAVVMSLVMAAATPSFAQFGATPNSIGGDSASELGGAAKRMSRGAEQAAQKPQVAPPPVLPGTKTAPEAAAPTKSAADMSPTEALFDAINRGDLAGARDAVNRGADLHGLNVLGMTPLEVSVDLGRNDISFMLLSQREASTSVYGIAGTGGRPGGNDRSADAASFDRPTSRGRGRNATIAQSAFEPEQDVVESARPYQGNGGAAIPSAGFLGFQQGRAGQ